MNNNLSSNVVLQQGIELWWFSLCRKTGILLFGIVIAFGVGAVPIGDIDIGDTYYINNILSENDLVVVKRIDRARGLVKVQYAAGGTDWVSPSKLLTRSGSRGADVEEAVIGTAVVAGALWAIFDPQGFKDAMSGSQSKSTSRSNAGSKTAASSRSSSGSTSSHVPRTAISAVPFAPVVDGSWAEEGQVWKNWSESVLSTEIGKSVAIDSVRTKRIPFYSTGSRNVVLVEAVQPGRSGAYYILAVSGNNTRAVLDGTGTPIHKMNSSLGFSVDSRQKAESYLKFFTSALSAENGIFVVLEPDADYLSKNALTEIGVEPVRIVKDKTGDWHVFADVIYGNDAFEAEFLVSRSGNVDMVNDTHKRELSFEYRVVMDAGRRFYVRSE